MISKTRILLAITAMATLPLLAQTQTTTTTRVTTTRTMHHGHESRARMMVYNDSSRLASLLQDIRSNAMLGPGAWKRSAGEASVLANRIYSSTTSNRTAHGAATELRMHVRKLRAAAMAGDAAGAKAHAAEASPYAYKLMDWSNPS